MGGASEGPAPPLGVATLARVQQTSFKDRVFATSTQAAPQAPGKKSELALDPHRESSRLAVFLRSLAIHVFCPFPLRPLLALRELWGDNGRVSDQAQAV